MSKRKNRSASRPNLPKATLERARRQAAGEELDEAESVEEVIGEPEEEAAPEPAKAEATGSRRFERVSERRAGSTRRRGTPRAYSQRRKSDVMDNEAIQEVLRHPTKHVSEEQLHEEYGHVVRDIRNMGVLAIGLMVLLVTLAQFI
jgi:hypothetical protein